MRQAQMTRNQRLWMCSTGETVEDRDGTAVVLLAPMGLWLLFSKQILIY